MKTQDNLIELEEMSIIKFLWIPIDGLLQIWSAIAHCTSTPYTPTKCIEQFRFLYIVLINYNRPTYRNSFDRNVLKVGQRLFLLSF